MKASHRPLARHRFVSAVSCILLIGAFVLLLLVAISLPILKPVYLLSVKSTVTGEVPSSVATELRFGVWGLCASSVLNQPTWFTNNGICYGPMLGYDIPSDLTNVAGSFAISSLMSVEKSLLVILVLHPIAAGFSFIGFVFAFFLGPHGIAIFTLIVTIIAGIVGSIVLAIDLALVIIVRKKIIDQLPYHFEVLFGPGTWMVLAAVAMTWLAVVFLSARACYCCGVRRHHDHHHHDSY
ncbi:hypothetical protein FPV67DRAFT_1487224 [Lyophyllum atratum]|nr:hypothetical protein FPV67DRAFT_1487224 [Lyophyllum atratum]